MGVAKCRVSVRQERVAVGVLPDKRVVFEIDVGEVVVELAVCVAEEGAGVLGSELSLGPLAEGDCVASARRVWGFEDLSCELHALPPERRDALTLEQVEHAFYLRPTEAALVRRERRVAVAHKGGALDELPPLAFLRVVRERGAEGGEYLREGNVRSKPRLPGGDAVGLLVCGDLLSV